MKWIKNSLSIIGVLALASLLINANSQDKNHNENEGESRPVKDYNVYALDLPVRIDFAGEITPLHIRDVRERLDRELLVNTYWQSNGLLLIKRANKYFPIIEPILKQNGIPEDFKYLALIESGLQNVVSPAGATGFWQFMKTTGREYGLEINDNIDERYHVEKATQAACNYLKDAKNRMGSWTLAAAAYNAGQAGINRQLERQKVTDYYDLLLNDETSRYVFRILAIKEIMSDPEKYGFNYKASQLYELDDTKNVVVDTTVADLTDFAKEHGINYKELKIYNPWLRDNFLQNKSGRTYVIKIPVKK